MHSESLKHQHIVYPSLFPFNFIYNLKTLLPDMFTILIMSKITQSTSIQSTEELENQTFHIPKHVFSYIIENTTLIAIQN